jgi:hypothetical protein
MSKDMIDTITRMILALLLVGTLCIAFLISEKVPAEAFVAIVASGVGFWFRGEMAKVEEKRLEELHGREVQAALLTPQPARPLVEPPPARRGRS